MPNNLNIKGTRFIEHKTDFENDCGYKYDYIPHILNPTSRTIAIGDIHGDLDVAIKMLEVGKCIRKISYCVGLDNLNYVIIKNKNNKDEYYFWIGQDTQVVQVGDQIDRCRYFGSEECIYPEVTQHDEASDIKILKFYTDINSIAKLCNGRVISLLGNHELMNVLGKMNYVSFMGIMEFRFDNMVDLSNIEYNINDINIGLQNRINAFSNKPNIKNRKEPLNEFLGCSRTSSIIIGDLLFVHGGMIKQMAEAYNLDDLNKIVRKWLLGKLKDEINSNQLLYTNNERNKNFQQNNKINFNFKNRIHQILSSKYSIFWNRLLGNLPPDIQSNIPQNINQCNEYLDDVFKIHNINGIIIGHTPQMSDKYGINSACNKRVWRVDIGASSAFDKFRTTKKKIEVLEIKYTIDNSPIFKILTMDY